MNAAALSIGRSVPASLLGLAAVCLLVTASAAAPLQRGHDVVEMGVGRAVPAVAVPQAASGRVRCAGCGVVENIRRIEATALVPVSYEFTVRLRDGSSRTSSNATATSWRVGDGIMLRGGEPRS
jgi:hypothetical protein